MAKRGLNNRCASHFAIRSPHVARRHVPSFQARRSRDPALLEPESISRFLIRSSASEKSSKKGEKGKNSMNSVHVSTQERKNQEIRLPRRLRVNSAISDILISIISTVLVVSYLIYLMFAIKFNNDEEVMREIVNRGFEKFPERDQRSFVLDRKEEKDRFRKALIKMEPYIHIYHLVTGSKASETTSLVQDVAKEILESEEEGLFYFNYGEDTVSYDEAILREFDEMVTKGRPKRIKSWLVKEVHAKMPSERCIGFGRFLTTMVCSPAVTYANKWNRTVAFILDTILHQDDGVQKLNYLQRSAKGIIDFGCPIHRIFVDSDGSVGRVFSSLSSHRGRFIYYQVNDVSREEAARLLESQNIGRKSLNTMALSGSMGIFSSTPQSLALKVQKN